MDENYDLCHAYGPAALPFEFISLADWLIDSQGICEAEALGILRRGTDLPLPASRGAIRDAGLSPEALSSEFQRGQDKADRGKLLAGIELVDIPGVSELSMAQIEADLCALKSVGADGLALSWDLWHIPTEYLELVRSIWCS